MNIEQRSRSAYGVDLDDPTPLPPRSDVIRSLGSVSLLIVLAAIAYILAFGVHV